MKHKYQQIEDSKLLKLDTGNEIIDTNEFSASTITRALIYDLFTSFDLKRLDNYSNNVIDYSLILNTIPQLSRLYFLNKISLNLTNFQESILLGVGLQNKTLNSIQTELKIGPVQILALFNKSIKKLTQCLRFIEEREIATEIAKNRAQNVNIMATQLVAKQTTHSMADDMEFGVRELIGKQEAGNEVKFGPKMNKIEPKIEKDVIPTTKSVTSRVSGAVKRKAGVNEDINTPKSVVKRQRRLD